MGESIGAWVAVVLALVLLGAVVGLYGQDIKAEVDMSKFVCPACNCPTLEAQAVADLVVIPGVDVPEFQNDQKVLELWKEMFSDDIEALEDLALELALAKVDKEEDDELLDFFESEIEGFDELDKFSEDEDERDVEVLNLGLDDEENQKVVVKFEFKVKWELKEGTDDSFKDRLYVTANVVWDEDEEELVAEDLVYSF